ncbi:T9SS type A sorting domain-containing protein [Flavobacterium lacus]|uniref:Putative secreted protein (Por secretion system target) n=1 Tax=Flavobacterium lacus TaxID=1353778 RepID=A0A328WT52_9FLAO|nr:T9SS type A sorting domain-containing protein [Flavobacterium lacus]RAR46558.1 putative secreted protein (Por secretion system target) [Flavobacterium lacus]
MKKTLLIALQVFFFYQISVANNVGNFEENNKNCSFILSERIDTVTPIFNNGSDTIQFCNGSTIPMLPTTSENGITGTWSPSTIDNTTSGNYVFTPNQGQDATAFTLQVIIISSITPNFSTNLTIYMGDNVPPLSLVSPNGVVGTWIPAVIDNTISGTYTFIPEPNQCASPITLVVDVIPIANPVAPSPQTFNAGSTLADIVITPSNVLWYDTFDDAQADVNRLSLSLPLENNKTYYAVNDDGEYRSQPFPVTVIVTLNTANIELQNLKFYPNPVSSTLTISTSFPIQSIEIYNLLGQRLINESYDATEVNVNVSNLPSALYLVKIKSENQTKEFKIVKE